MSIAAPSIAASTASSSSSSVSMVGMSEPSQVARSLAPMMSIAGTEFDDGREDLAVSHRTPLTSAQWQRVRQAKQKMMWLTILTHTRVMAFRAMLHNQHKAKSKLQRLLAPVIKRVNHLRQRHAVIVEYSWPSIEMMRMAPVLRDLGEEVLLLLQQKFRYCQHEDLESIVLRGEVCNALWCIGVGTCVEKNSDRALSDEGQRTFGPGDWFGELLGVAASPVTISTRGACHLYHITRDDFFGTRGCEEQSPQIEEIYVKECLRTLPSTFPITPQQCQALPYLSSLSQATLQHYAAAMTPMVFRRDEELLVEGRQPAQVYIMVMGEVEYACAARVGYPQPIECRRSVGALSGLSSMVSPALTYEWIGHEGIILREPQRYTCRAVSNIVKVYAVPPMVLLDIIMEVPGFLIECRAALAQRRAQSMVCRAELIAGIFSIVPEGSPKLDALAASAEGLCVTKGEPLVAIGRPITHVCIVTNGRLVGTNIGTGPPLVVGAVARLENATSECDPSKGSAYCNLPQYVIGAWEMLEYHTWPREWIAGTVVEGFAIPCEAIRSSLQRTEKFSKVIFHRIMNIAHQCKLVDMHDPTRKSTSSESFGTRTVPNPPVAFAVTQTIQIFERDVENVTPNPPSSRRRDRKPKVMHVKPQAKIVTPLRSRHERPRTHESARPIPPSGERPRSTTTRRPQKEAPVVAPIPRVVAELFRHPEHAFHQTTTSTRCDCVIREIEDDGSTTSMPQTPLWPTVPYTFFELITPKDQRRSHPQR